MEDVILFFQRFKPCLYARFCRIAAARQASVCLIMENVFKLGNLGAIARSCDALGIQQVGYLSTYCSTKYRHSLARTSKGASQWVTYTPFEDTATHIDQLHREGWHVLATSSVEQGQPFDEIDFAAYPKLALMVGSESEGLSASALHKADQLITIPMHGFVESFNVLFL
ncbi:MAG: TrmH family RNA methyltransferase [Cytophagales bacterium]